MRRTIFNEEHEMFRSSVRAFMEKEIVPNHEQWEKDGQVDKAMSRKAGSLGLLGMAVPEVHGGGGMKISDTTPLLMKKSSEPE